MTAADVHVRLAVPADGPRIVELDRELARFERLQPPDEEEAARLLGWIFRLRRMEALVAELDGRIEGIALFYEGLGSFRARPFLHLEDLVIAESARSRGVGEALMEALAREALRRKALRLEWAVLDWNEGAMRFYRRLGARPQTEWLRYVLEEPQITKLASGDGGRKTRDENQ
ncbi:MAG TPA: GNAT family N-acetyltransferase [Thermoanaerobaculia bacterium]|nr:GNAT family N-acetyltransferase [Thermoanaerobaculia bacterium]